MGDNADFVRALSRVKGLENLLLEGHYVERGPAYLEQMLGIAVEARKGYRMELNNLDTSEIGLAMETFKHEHNE